MSNIISSLNNNSVTSSTSTTATSNANVTTAGTQMLTQADFLKIMVAQFTQQDPLSSSDGSGDSSGTSDYVNELMSMTNLTTMQTMSGQQAQQLAESLPGDTVEVDNNGAYSSGVVQSARLNASDDGVYFTVGGTEYPLSDLYSVNGNQTTAETTAAANTASPAASGVSGTTATN
jgi:flagellar hook assembly protein FlgD